MNDKFCNFEFESRKFFDDPLDVIFRFLDFSLVNPNIIKAFPFYAKGHCIIFLFCMVPFLSKEGLSISGQFV